MKMILIGELKSTGKLLIGDPFSDDKATFLKLKIKKGKYDVFVVKNDCDENAELLIIHQKNTGKFNFKKEKQPVLIDTARCAFLNEDKFMKKVSKKVPLLGSSVQSLIDKKNNILKNIEKIEEKDNYKSLEFSYARENVFNDDMFLTSAFFRKMIEVENVKIQMLDSLIDNNLEQITKYVQDEEVYKLFHQSLKVLKGTTVFHPYYPEVKFSNDYLIIINDLASYKEQAGVIEDVGVVSSSANCDGSYPVFTSKDGQNSIEAVYVSFTDI